jgi:hypothetical protein
VKAFPALLLLAATALYAQEVAFDTPSKLPSWAFFDEAAIGTRALSEKDSTGASAGTGLQHNILVSGGVRYQGVSLHFLAATGGDFATRWNNSGAGLTPASAAMYVKQLYLSDRLAEGVELQYGGVGIKRGAGSDIANYSDDGYMTGERLTVHRRHNLYFDEVSVTYGYLGDRDTPGIQHRFRRLRQVNYRQYLVVRKFGEWAGASFDYTDQGGARTFRQSVDVQTPWLRYIDRVQMSLYERTNFTGAAGGVLTLEKELNPRWTVAGGYASIDRHYGDWNADTFFHGRRIYVETKLRLTDSLQAFVLINKAVGNSYLIPNGSHLDAGFRYDVLKGLHAAGVL